MKEKENEFQKSLIKELKERFPKSIVLKNDPNYIQGIPDLLILNNKKWAALECKRDKDASHRPNQDYYVDKMDAMSYSTFIYPENREEVLSVLDAYLGDISWHNNAKKFPKDGHALFGASNYHWLNYSQDKMVELYTSSKAKKIGTELHELACRLIKQKVKLPDDTKKTLNMYVNDAIMLGLRPEEQLYYSQFFFGTADAIGIVDKVLHIHDLKTGKTKASMHQLEIYAAFFCLEYDLVPSDFDDVELRIYQSDEVIVGHATNDIIVPIMDKIITTNAILEKLKEDENV